MQKGNSGYQLNNLPGNNQGQGQGQQQQQPQGQTQQTQTQQQPQQSSPTSGGYPSYQGQGQSQSAPASPFNVQTQVQPSGVFDDRLMRQRANQAAAQNTVSWDWMRDQTTRPGMQVSSGSQAAAYQPYAQSVYQRTMAPAQSMLQDQQANAEHQLRGNVARWQESLGYAQPMLDVYNTQAQGQLSAMDALAQLLFGLQR